MQFLIDLGVTVKGVVLALAALLVGDAVPGNVVVILFVALLGFTSAAWRKFRRRTGAVRALRGKLKEISDRPLAEGRETISGWLAARKGNENTSLSDAWEEFDETLFVDRTYGEPVLRNAVRPASFFNIDDLHFGAGFFRILPGLFVSIGLALTFLGLIAALTEMSQGGSIDAGTMSRLLGIASAKFIMSLSGLVCSILFTVVLRRLMGALDEELHLLCRALERKLTFASLEEIGIRQLQAATEARDHQRQLAMEMVAEIGRPLREQQEMLPRAISDAIGNAMQPLLEKAGQQGSESMSSMVANLSDQLTSGVAAALAKASDSLSEAGERIGRLADRMDQSSGRMGSEIESSVARVALAVDELRGAMSATAQSTSGAFTAGAEQLLAVMNSTLEGIRDNTGEGARALSAAAGEMRDAAQSMRTELEGAARDGADAARARMTEAGAAAQDAIGAAGRDMMAAFGNTSTEIARMTEALSSKASEEILNPIGQIADRLDTMVATLEAGAGEMRRMSDSMKQGAVAGSEAATSFRTASQDLASAATPVRAINERIEGSVRQMTEGTEAAVALMTESARGTAQTLAAAQEAIAAERRGIDATLSGVSEMLRRMQGQGERLDTMDEKLGAAFDQYTKHVDHSLQALRSHVQEMSGDLDKALSTMLGIVEQLQEFQPQQARR